MQSIKCLPVITMCLVGCLLIALTTGAIADEEVDMSRLAEGNNAFALDLYERLSPKEGNLFFSPYSISTALAMTYAGAREETAEQMADVLHFDLEYETLHPAFADLSEHFQSIQQAGNVALNIANALWIQQDFELLEQFLDTVKEHYDAGLFQVNFAGATEEARVQINNWVEEYTNGKIKNLLAPGVLTALTRLVLTNAIYFKGDWAIQFEEESTKEEPFCVTPEHEVPVLMMTQTNTFKYGEDDLIQILQMPYKGEELSMTILLPKEKDGLAKLEKELHTEQLTNWLSQLFSRDVEVFLPKFKLTSQFSLAGTLKDMGMTDAFSDSADFSGIEPGRQLNISEVIHKAFVEVNEEGTEAAASTAVVFELTSVAEPHPILVFKADHPFIFLIQDNQTGSILFMGRIMNPSE